MLVQDFLEASADRSPNKIGLICDDQHWSYIEIEESANRLANALLENGLARGDRVALFLPNCVELVIAIFAVLKAGCVFVIINPTTKFDKLVYVLDNCGARALVMSGRNPIHTSSISQEVQSLHTTILTSTTASNSDSFPFLSYETIQNEFSSERLSTRNIDRDLACLIYTSGSTGEPKGVMSDHSNVVFAASSIIKYLENFEEDIVINALPLSFDYGLYQLLMTFKYGGTLVLERSFAFPAAFLNRMEQECVTGLPGVPTMFSMLLQMDLSQFDLSNLRYITNTAAALPASHIQSLREIFPGVRIFSMYGLTETKRTLYLPPEHLDDKPNSVGIAIPGTEVWIEDEHRNKLDSGEIGELIVRGRHVMRGYWRDEEATRERYRSHVVPGERVCMTGDLFKMDDDGYMYFVGRKDDIIKSRGEKVAPKELENLLYGFQGVLEAAVVGIPDPILGEAIKVFVVASDETLTEADILAFCKANLEDYMTPKFVELREELPKTESGKINKRLLVQEEKQRG